MLKLQRERERALLTLSIPERRTSGRKELVLLETSERRSEV